MAPADVSDLEAVSDIAQALEQDPYDGAHELCWTALGRVTDDDPTYVFNEGDESGMNVGVMVLTGPFTGCEVRAMISCPLGSGFKTSPIRGGQRVLVHFLEGKVNGLCVVAANVPGGVENPLPTVIAGVPVDEGGLDKNEVTAPPKGVGSREYYRGAIKVIRLKGKQDDFFSGFVVSADDGTSLEMRWNSVDQEYVIVAKGKKGERLQIGGGIAGLFSPNGKNSVQVSDESVFINAEKFKAYGSTCAEVDGGMVLVGMGVLPPTPANACAVGPAGPANVFSTKVYVGLG